MTKDLTEGRPIVLLFRFAIPLVMGNLFQQLYNIIDAMIVGKTLGINALSAVGASASVNFLILGFCIGTCVGLAIPVAREFGAGNYRRMRVLVINGYYAAAFVTIIMTVCTSLFCDNILNRMNTPELIYTDAYIYQLIIFLGIPFTILYNLLASVIRALGDSKTPFYFLLISTFGNILLDLFCIKILHMGVAGAGIATIFSQGVAGILCLIYMNKRYEILHFEHDEKRLILPECLKLLGFGIPMGLQSSITAIGSIMLQTAVNSLGTLEVAGYAAALKIKGVFICPFDAIGSAVATFCSQNLGAGKYDRLKKGIRSGVIIGLCWCVITFVMLQLFTDNIAMLFVENKEVEVLRLVRQFMHTTSFFYPALAFLGAYRFAIQGVGYSKVALFSGLMEMIARSGMSIWVIPRFRFDAVVFTDQTAWVSAAIFCMIVFYVIYHKKIYRG
ncbi:MAG: MATE family efflux transporter [Lachnospiraceae bacterium]|nr:MATE family efflux transporter [Candidatus Colinaster scatohippi]